jgi:hypothetical protein
MKGTISTLFRRPLIIATLTLTFLVASVSTVGATSYSTTTTIPGLPTICGVIVNRSVHFVSKGSPCVIRVRPGANVRIRMRSGFRWGYPISSSRAVVVTDISRDSVGVFAATLHGAVAGRATIRSTGTIVCRPGVACPDLVLLWSLVVIVT